MAGRVDSAYARARLVQVMTTFFPGNLSIGLGKCGTLDCDNYDNGLYVIDSKTLEIKDRKFFDDREEQQEYDIVEMSESILRAITAAAYVR